MTDVSKDMEIELRMKYAGMCEISGVIISLGDDGGSDDSDSDDLETYDGLAGELTVTNVECSSLIE